MAGDFDREIEHERQHFVDDAPRAERAEAEIGDAAADTVQLAAVRKAALAAANHSRHSFADRDGAALGADAGIDHGDDVAGLTDIPIGPGAILTVDLVDPEVVDRELIVQSSNRVFVERSLPRGAGLDGRSGSWALPSAGG